ncbi:MAG: ankyrin repeat domain-containing protein [Boseongicola sp. SB0677_bin_26]|nr:ankyrin repeat domain-containing protein [Boseongicola sp. SB0665_bin_10]MYG28585.1 ankyrin repeat domain-containing protein [Boseongicola sp. SB0677_bin_26]
MALSAAVMVLAATGAGAQSAEFLFGDFLEVTPQEVVAYIESGGDLEIRNHQTYTLMHWAAWAGEIEIARGLLDRGVNVDISTPDGMTPMMLAGIVGRPDMVAFFLDEGADYARTNDKGYTALHLWALNGHPDTLTHLLDAGSDPLLRVNTPEKSSHHFLPLDGVRKHNPWALDTEAGRRLERLTYQGTGCEGVIVLPSDKKLTVLAERTLGKASKWREIAELNGLGPDKGYQLGDCLKLP